MNKKVFALALIPSLLLASCELLDILVEEVNTYSEQEEQKQKEDNKENKQENQDKENQEPDPITFNITSAKFIDEVGHLKVNYECNYGSPFNIPSHTYSHLNITGVLAKEVDSSNDAYFTLLSPIIQTTLKFEFYDTDGNMYLSNRFENVEPYNDETTDPSQTITYPDGYNTLYWSDEFNGNSLDTSKWTYDIGNGNYGWGNGESQYYTDHNETVNNGVLTIKGKKENIESYSYTSTRIKTQNKVKFTYGYIEASIALPTVTGMWPAFWMMPNNSY